MASTPPAAATIVIHASTSGRAASPTNTQKVRSPPASHPQTTTPPARCASSMTRCPPLIGDITTPCDAAASVCIIKCELLGDDTDPPVPSQHVVELADAAVPPRSCNAACRTPCPPTSNAVTRAGLRAAPTNGATATTVSPNNATSTQPAGVAPSPAVWPA